MIKQRRNIVRARAGLRVSLKTEGRLVSTMHTLQGPIEQGPMRGAQCVRKFLLVYRKTVVLAGDHDFARRQVLHRVIGTVMTELHLHGLRTTGQ